MADNEMSREEKKVLMRALWGALLSPPWTKDDLITFGKAIFAKKSLKEMDDATFNAIFPFLDKVTTDLGSKLSEAAEEQRGPKEEEAKAPPPSEQPGSKIDVVEGTNDEPERAVK